MTRRARWIGTRGLPVVVAGAAVLMLGSIASVAGLSLVLTFLFPAALGLVVVSVWSAKNAWCHLSDETDQVDSARAGGLFCCYLAAGAAIVVVLAAGAIGVVLESWTRRPYQSFAYAVDSQTGDVWLTKSPNPMQAVFPAALDDVATPTLRGARFTPDTSLAQLLAEQAPVPAAVQLRPAVHATRPSQRTSLGGDGFFLPDGAGQVYDARGYILRYRVDRDDQMHLESVIDRDGRHPGAELSHKPFDYPPTPINEFHRWMSGTSFVMDREWIAYVLGDGVVQLDPRTGRFETLIDMPIDWIATVDWTQSIMDFSVRENEVPQDTTLILGSGNRVHQYRLHRPVGQPPGNGAGSERAENGDGRFVAEQERMVTLPPELTGSKHLSVRQAAFSEAGCTLVIDSLAAMNTMVVKLSDDGEILEQLDVQNDLGANSLWASLPLGMIPPGVYLLGEGVNFVRGRLNDIPYRSLLSSFLENRFGQLGLFAVAVVMCVSCGIQFWLARRQYLGARATCCWCLLSLLLGLAGPLTFLAISPRIVTDTCLDCQRRRPVRGALCPYCQQPWTAPPRTGVEIMDSDASPSPFELVT